MVRLENRADAGLGRRWDRTCLPTATTSCFLLFILLVLLFLLRVLVFFIMENEKKRAWDILVILGRVEWQ